MHKLSRKPLGWRSRVCIALLALIGSASAFADTVNQLDIIEIISITPIHGSGASAEKYPANVQVFDSRVVQDGGQDLTDTLNRRAASVTLNAAQNNPLQPDLQYRGFTASPLLGLPQGIAIYADGVRQNSVFGDTMHWDTIPQHAYESINLMPGSNPLFGLNTLGGALSLRSKTGFDYKGSRVSVEGGSFDRRTVEAETGGAHGDWAHYLALSVFDEDGWRDYSPSEAKNLFGKLSWRADTSTLDIGLNLSDSNLIGNGATPIELLQQDRSAIFTRPDQTENEQLAITFNGDIDLNDQLLLAANAYYRRHNIDTLNGDDSDIEECTVAPNVGFLCVEDDGAEELVLDPNGNSIPEAESLEGATINTSQTEQDSFGLSLQAEISSEINGMDNQLTIGTAWDQGDAHYRSQTELGSLDSTRFAVGGGVIDGGSFVNVKSETRNIGLFFSNILDITDELTLNLAGRWNRSNIELKDQIGTALNGDHTFNRFNPAAGLTYVVNPTTTVYGSYSEATRAPTPVELTCADPDDPCRLPNAFVADPPLEQVVAKTFEVGARGRAQGVNWNASVFTTTNKDDIIFISSGALTSEGYFDNIGDTRRRGIELGLNGQAFNGSLGWFASYTYLDATFRTPFTAPSQNHPNAVGGEIQVEKGDRIPGIPEHVLKLGADYRVTPALTFGGELIYNSDQFLRADESNQLDPIDDYTVVNLRGRYRINDTFSITLRVDNLFDTEYETFGVLGEPDEVLGAQYDDPRFLGAGAPRSGWLGLEARF